VIGWIADFFRFWWALVYWNIRKTWFRLAGAHRDSCPCQEASDSGLALDSRCAAVLGWRDPRRFRRVCPLLVQTKDGWRCSVDAERVRPFWMRAFLFGGAAAATLYLVATLGLFMALRTTGYDVAYAMVAWPGRWAELRSSQERLYATRAQEALVAGDYQTAILALQTVCRLNPRNLPAGLMLARLSLLAGQPSIAEYIYSRLMHDVPEQRPAIARVWIRSLLAAGNYQTVKPLATAMLSEDSGHRDAWMRALVFAARQTNDEAALAPVLSGEHGLPEWCVEIAAIEQQLLLKRPERALSRLNRVAMRAGSSYLPCYQADRLLVLGRAEPAVNLLKAYGSTVPADAGAILRMRAFDALGWTALGQAEFDGLMGMPMNSRLATLVSAHLITHPAATRSEEFLRRFIQEPPALTDDTLAIHHAAYLLATLRSQGATAEAILRPITTFTKSDARPLRGLAQLVQSGAPAREVRQVLPVVPLPIEVVYALLERPEKAASR
jgi:hypothetical protein